MKIVREKLSQEYWEQVVRGEKGLLFGDCQKKGWIDLATSSPFLMRELAQELE